MKYTKFVPKTMLLLLLTSLELTLVSCKKHYSPPRNPTGCENAVDFERPLVLGSQYGQPAGHQSGNVVFTSNGIPVSVHNFSFTSGGGTFGVAYIDTLAALNSGQCLRSNNINLTFDLRQLQYPVNQVTFDYLDMGGFENFSVNGSPILPGELTSLPSSIGGVSITVSQTPVKGGKKGIVTLKGAIKTFTVGGQELWLDQVCVAKATE